MQGTNRRGERREKSLLIAICDPGSEFQLLTIICRMERKKKGEDNKWDEKQRCIGTRGGGKIERGRWCHKSVVGFSIFGTGGGGCRVNVGRTGVTV